MKQSTNWDEKRLENCLKQLPQIKDKQSKAELFKQIKANTDELQIKERKKNKSWLVPSLAVASVFFFLLLMIPSFLNQVNVREDLAINKSFKVKEAAEQANQDANEMRIMKSTPKTASLKNVDDFLYLGAVQPSEAELLQEQLVTIALPVQASTRELVLPVTLISDGANEIERFLKVKETFSGEAWGIGMFPHFPINSIVARNKQTLKIDVPQGSLESLTSSEALIYQQSLKETFWPKFREIELSSDGKPGVDLGQTGSVSRIDLQVENRGYYLFESKTGHIFLARGITVAAPQKNANNQYLSLQETIEFMKQGNQQLGYHAAIPEEFVITNVLQTGNIATITFTEGTILEDNPKNLAMIEAILFAARDFGNTFVQFEGLEATHVGPYSLTKAIEIPRYANFIR